MTGRGRFLAALKGEQPDHVPFWELEFHLFNKYSDQPLVLGKEFERADAPPAGSRPPAKRGNIVEVAAGWAISAVTAPGGVLGGLAGRTGILVAAEDEFHWKQLGGPAEGGGRRDRAWSEA